MTRKLVALLLAVMMLVAFTTAASAKSKPFLKVKITETSQEEVTFAVKWKGHQYCSADAIVTLSDRTSENSKVLYPIVFANEVPEDETYKIAFAIMYEVGFPVSKWEVRVRLIDLENGVPFFQESDFYISKGP